MPPARCEGRRHMPHGSDWSSSRDAGMNAETRGAEPGDVASTDEEGYAQEGYETVVTRTQRNRLTRWSQKGTRSRHRPPQLRMCQAKAPKYRRNRALEDSDRIIRLILIPMVTHLLEMAFNINCMPSGVTGPARRHRKNSGSFQSHNRS